MPYHFSGPTGKLTLTSSQILTLKMHQTKIRLRLCPRPNWRSSLYAPSDISRLGRDASSLSTLNALGVSMLSRTTCWNVLLPLTTYKKQMPWLLDNNCKITETISLKLMTVNHCIRMLPYSCLSSSQITEYRRLSSPHLPLSPSLAPIRLNRFRSLPDGVRHSFSRTWKTIVANIQKTTAKHMKAR